MGLGYLLELISFMQSTKPVGVYFSGDDVAELRERFVQHDPPHIDHPIWNQWSDHHWDLRDFLREFSQKYRCRNIYSTPFESDFDAVIYIPRKLAQTFIDEAMTRFDHGFSYTINPRDTPVANLENVKPLRSVSDNLR